MGDNTDIEINLNDDNNEIEINREQIIYTGISEEKVREIEGDIDNLEEVAGIDVETFSTSSTYAVGDTVVKDKKIYKCIVAVATAGAWNANNWTEVSIRDLIDDLDSDVIKEVKLNGTTVPKTGNSVNVNGVEVVSNKVTEIDEESTDTEYPSAKCVYDNFVSDRERITQLETDKALLEDLIPTDTAEGETIDIDDSAKYYFKEFVPEGQTEQESTDGRQLFNINGNVNQIYNGSTYGNLNVVNGNDLTSSYNTGTTYARGQRIYIGTGNTVKFKFKFKSINGRIEGADPLVGVADIYEDNKNTPINTIYLNTNNVGTDLSATITATTDYLIFAFSGWTSRAESITVTDIVVTTSNDTSWEPYSGGIPRTKSILSISY